MKIILLISFIFFSVSTHAQEDFPLTIKEQILKQLNLVTENFRPISLEYTWPERMMPDDVDEAFAPHHDLPAYLLNIKVTKLQEILTTHLDHWKNRLDIDMFQALNLEAARIWSDLLLCQNSDEKLASELARNTYRKKDDFCPLDDSKEDEMEKRVTTFHQRVSQYLLSGQLQRLGRIGKIFDQIPTGIIATSTREKMLEFNKDPDILPVIHPFLVQVFAENFAQSWHFYNVDSDEDKNFQEFLFKVIKNPKYSSNLDIEEKNRAIKLVNTLAFFDILPAGKCSLWGFWPGALRSVFNSTSDYDYCFENHCLQIQNIVSKLLHTCGAPVDLNSLSLYRQHKGRFGNSYYHKFTLKTLLDLPKKIITGFADPNELFIDEYRDIWEQYEE